MTRTCTTTHRSLELRNQRLIKQDHVRHALVAVALSCLYGCGGGGDDGSDGGGPGVPPDTTAPDTTISSGPTGLTTATAATYSFTSTESNSTFQVSLDGGAYVTVASPYMLSSLSDGNHTLNVRARDAAGNADPTPASRAWTVDTTLPTARVLFPLPVAYTDADELTFRGTATDANGIDGIEVDGVAASSSDGFATWTATVPINQSGPQSLVVSVTDAAGNNASNAASVSVNNNGPSIVTIGGIDYESLGNRVLVADSTRSAIYAYEVSGNTGVLMSDFNAFQPPGSSSHALSDLVVDVANNRALVLDWGFDQIVAIDLDSWDMTVVSPAGSSSAPTNLILGFGIALDAVNDRVFVTNRGTRAIVAVNLSTGARSVVSSPIVGSGTNLANPLGIAYDDTTNPASPRLLVADATLAPNVPGIVAIDLATGNRSMFSSASPTGAGAALQAPISIKLDAVANRVLVTDTGTTSHALVAIDLVSGARTTLSSSTIGSGPVVQAPNSLAFDASTGRAFMGETYTGEIYEMSVATSVRTRIVHSNVGTGPRLFGPGGMAIEQSSGAATSLLVADPQLRSLLRVDLATGNRSVVSSDTIGNGFSFGAPNSVVLDTRSTTTTPSALVMSGNPTHAIVSVDLSTGTRTQLADLNFNSVTPVGAVQRMTLDAVANRVIFPDATLDTLFAVNLSTQTRTVLSAASFGSGINFNLPSSVVFESGSGSGSGRFLVTDSQAAFGVLTVNAINGNRSILSSTIGGYGSGPTLTLPGNMALDQANNRVLTVDQSLKYVVAIDLTSGNRTLLSGRNPFTNALVGNGPPQLFSNDIVYDSVRQVLFLDASENNAILAIDVVSGDRVIVTH